MLTQDLNAQQTLGSLHQGIKQVNAHWRAEGYNNTSLRKLLIRSQETSGPYTPVQLADALATQKAEAAVVYTAKYTKLDQKLKNDLENCTDVEEKITNLHQSVSLHTGAIKDSYLAFLAKPAYNHIRGSMDVSLGTSFSNSMFAEMLRRRLGMEALYTNYLPAECSCSSHTALRQSTNNMYHLDTCSQSKARYSMHKAMVKELCSFVNRSSGLSAEYEVPIDPGDSKKTMDMVVHLSDGKVLCVDVTLINPYAVSNRTLFVQQHLSWDQRSASLKISKYSATLDRQYGRGNYTMIPFVMVSTGGFGGQARDFLSFLTKSIMSFSGYSKLAASLLVRYFKITLAVLQRRYLMTLSRKAYRALVPQGDVDRLQDLYERNVIVDYRH